jgi:hypothetical protein
MNPTRTQLRIWAYGNYSDPVSDFQLFVAKDPYIGLDLAADPRCPRRDFFLESLYVWVGDQVRLGLPDKGLVIKILETADELPDERIKKFVERSKGLILDPYSYDSNKWGIGGSYYKE